MLYSSNTTKWWLSILILVFGLPTQAQTNGFIENQGQWPDEVLFLARLPGQNVWVTREALICDFYEVEEKPHERENGSMFAPGDLEREVRGHVVELRFEGRAQRGALRVRPERALSTRLNYFIGNDPARHASNVPVYEEVTLEGLYEGVDLRLGTQPGTLTLTFATDDATWLAPVQLTAAGGGALFESNETTMVTTNLGNRQIGIVRGEVRNSEATRWFAGSVRTGGISVDLGRPANELRDDRSAPVRSGGGGLDFATFLGGTSGDNAYAVSLDPDGSATVAGGTHGSNFPTTSGAYDETHNGDRDAFVARLSADGSSLLYSTFLGGTDSDHARAVALGPDGSATITGRTSSSDFPTTPGAYDETHNGQVDAFVARLSADGSSLLYSTFLGGTNFDIARAVALGPDGSATITGDTSSSGFPTTSGAYDETFDGSIDAFVARLSTDGSSCSIQPSSAGRIVTLPGPLPWVRTARLL